MEAGVSVVVCVVVGRGGGVGVQGWDGAGYRGVGLEVAEVGWFISKEDGVGWSTHALIQLTLSYHGSRC